MKQLKLLLLLSALFGVSSLYPAAESLESKEGVQGLDEVVADKPAEPRLFKLGEEQLSFSPELYNLSELMKNVTEDQGPVLELDAHYLVQLKISLQQIHDLLTAISDNRLTEYLDSLSMHRVLSLFETANYLGFQQDIMKTLADYIVNRTINTPANRRFAASAITHSLNTDLESLLKKRFDTHPERFRHTRAGLVLKRHTMPVTSVAYSPDGGTIASGSWDNTVKIWNAATGAIVNTLNGHTRWVESVAYSPDGLHIASGSYDRTIKIWDAATGAVVHTLAGHTDCVDSVAFSPNGLRIASGSRDNAVKIWDLVTGTVRTLNGHRFSVTSVAYSPDGKHIASGSYDRTIKIWDATTGAVVNTLNGHRNWVTSVAYSPDGTRIASGSSDNTAKIWTAATGAVVHTLAGHTDWVESVAYSPDGKHIASGSYDRTIKIWDAATGQELSTLNGHTENVDSVAFSPDGSRIASGSYDNIVRLWDIPSIADAQLTKMYTIAQIESDVEEQIKNASQSIVKNRGLTPFISGSGAFQKAPLRKNTKSLALSVLKRSAPSAAAETAAAATVEPESVPAARPQYYDTLLPAYSATAEPEDNVGFSQDEIAQAITNSLQEQTRIPAPSGMAAAAEVSTEVPAEPASSQPGQYWGGPSIHEVKDNSDDE